jgi:hypothetical protein
MVTKTNATKKLALSKETLRQLTHKELKDVRGGTHTASPTADCLETNSPTADCSPGV